MHLKQQLNASMNANLHVSRLQVRFSAAFATQQSAIVPFVARQMRALRSCFAFGFAWTCADFAAVLRTKQSNSALLLQTRFFSASVRCLSIAREANLRFLLLLRAPKQRRTVACLCVIISHWKALVAREINIRQLLPSSSVFVVCNFAATNN